MSLFKDETGGYSSARVLLWVWSVAILYLVLFHISTLTQPVLTFLSSVYLFLATWAAGPRMIAYLSPLAAQITQSIATSKNVTASSDVSEHYKTEKG